MGGLNAFQLNNPHWRWAKKILSDGQSATSCVQLRRLVLVNISACKPNENKLSLPVFWRPSYQFNTWFVLSCREMERLEQERKIQELEELRRKVRSLHGLLGTWHCPVVEALNLQMP